MGVLLERLAEKKLLVSDGAWGTMLQAKGLPAGVCVEEWNISHPEAVKEVAAAYAAAGSDVILSNSFGGSACKLEHYNMVERGPEFNAAAARLTREAAPEAITAASVGPTGEFVEPYGDLEEEEMEAIFSTQIQALLEGGAQAICVETMTSVEEAACAIRAAKKLDPTIDVIATMTFDPVQTGGYKTMMGVAPEQAAKALTEAGADVIGSNCGNGIEQMIEITKALRAVSDKPILIHANAGVPELMNGQTVFRQTPEEMAAKVGELVAAGASIIGGCCGTNPEHISAMAAAVAKLRG